MAGNRSLNMKHTVFYRETSLRYPNRKSTSTTRSASLPQPEAMARMKWAEERPDKQGQAWRGVRVRWRVRFGPGS